VKFFGPKHTPESVAAELIEGLENGTITLDEPEVEGCEPPAAEPGEPVSVGGSGALVLLASFALAVVATGIVSTVLLFATRDPLPWVFPVACFAACVACAAVAFWLGTALSLRVANSPKLPSSEITLPKSESDARR
jgi:hypothetical protein